MYGSTQDGYAAPADESGSEEVNPLDERTTEEGGSANEADEGGEGGSASPEMVEVDGKEYDKSTPEYITALESVSTRYSGAVSKMHDATQALAKASEQKTDNQGKPPEDNLPSYRQPGWKPESLADISTALIEAEEVGMKKIEARENERSQQASDAENTLEDWVGKVQEGDKEFNKDEFFTYVGKHKIVVNTTENLDSAYSTYNDRSQSVKDAEQTARQNVAKRGADSTTAPGAAGGEAKGLTWQQIRSVGGNAMEAARLYMGK